MNEERSCVRASGVATKTGVLVAENSHGTRRGFRQMISLALRGRIIVLGLINKVEHYKATPWKKWIVLMPPAVEGEGKRVE